MPTADLRALAESLGLVRDCPLADLDLGEIGGDCPFCNGTGQRLPTEAEVRAAIFEAGYDAIDLEIGSDAVIVDVLQGFLLGPEIRAAQDECAPEEMVLLALLRALEACRG